MKYKRRKLSSSIRAERQETEPGNHFTTKLTSDSEGVVAKTGPRSIPPESQVSIARFEGPNIALYSKNPKFALTELTLHLSSLSRTLKKRFVIKTDPSIRLPEEQTRLTVAKLLPKEVVVSAVFCDDATGEVILEVNKPEAITPELVIEIADRYRLDCSHQTISTYPVK